MGLQTNVKCSLVDPSINSLLPESPLTPDFETGQFLLLGGRIHRLMGDLEEFGHLGNGKIVIFSHQCCS